MQPVGTENKKRQPHEGASVVEYGLVLSLLVLALMSGLEAVGMMPKHSTQHEQQVDLSRFEPMANRTHLGN